MEVRNAGIFQQLVHQVETWRDEAAARPANGVPVTLQRRS
jgi:hypothetical protein